MNQETQTLDETMNKTDFGHWIYENRKLIFVLIGAILVAGIGYSVYSSQKSKAENESLAAIYSFSKEVVTPFIEDKLKADEFQQKVDTLPAHIWSQANIVPVMFNVINKHIESDNWGAAKVILEKLNTNFTSDPMKSFFINVKLATVQENMGDNQGALATYQSLLKGKFNPIESRIYLHIGRLHKILGDAAKANENFAFIIEKHPNSEDAKLAKLYMIQ
jgi:predicted negative regulator of RcsB-dependent stress response